MRRPLAFLLVTVSVSMIGAPGFSDAIIPQDQLKWSQLPRLDRYGYDFSSETLIASEVASDFLCTDPRAVDKLHWWGSFWHSSVGYPTYYSSHWNDPSLVGGQAIDPGIISGFNIQFYTDVPDSPDPAVPMPWSHPGQLLYDEFLPMSAVQVVPYASIDRNADGIVGNDGDEVVWQYFVRLTEPFEQELGHIYWLKIQAVNHVDNPDNIQWGWHESIDLWNDESVQHGPALLWGLMYMYEWVELPNKDMAFELGVVPEPATVALFGLGLLGLSAVRSRRQR